MRDGRTEGVVDMIGKAIDGNSQPTRTPAKDYRQYACVHPGSLKAVVVAHRNAGHLARDAAQSERRTPARTLRFGGPRVAACVL